MGNVNRHCGLDPQSRGAGRGVRHTGYPYRHSKHPHRHCGLDPQSRGVRPAPSFPRRRQSTGWCAWCRHSKHPHRHCGLDPQSRGAGRGVRHTGCPYRHCGLDPQSTGRGVMRLTARQHQPYNPSPLMGEESKVRVKTMHKHRPNPVNPHNPVNPDSHKTPPHPVDSRLRGNDGPGRPSSLWIADQVRNDGIPVHALWIADQVRNDGLVFTLCSRVKHWDRLWSSSIKGEGDDGWS